MNLKIKKIMCLFLACLILGSCATKAKRVLPLPYANISSLKNLECNSLEERLEVKNNELVLISRIQDRRARKDTGWVTGFVIGGLFVPFLWIGAFFPKGDDEMVNRIAKLKGEVLAIERQMASAC